MRIVHVITSLGQGGAEAMLEKLIRTSAEQTPHVEHTVVSLGDAGVVGASLQRFGVEVHALQIRNLFSAFSALSRLAKIIRSHPTLAVVQTWMYHADAIGGVVARLLGRKRVFWNLRVQVLRKDFRLRTYLVMKLCAALSASVPRQIVSCGPAVRNSHIACGYQADKLRIIGNGFDVRKFRPADEARVSTRAALGVGREDLLVGSLSRMALQKDYTTLALAARIVSDVVPRARFLWIGKGVDEDASLSALLRQLRLESRVYRLGARSDTVALLNSFDVFCLSSRSEGFPNVLGEAMACGVACVTTAAGDAGFVLGDDNWVVPTESPSALGAALAQMLNLSPQSRAAIGALNRRRVENEFDIRGVWSRYLAMYEASP